MVHVPGQRVRIWQAKHDERTGAGGEPVSAPTGAVAVVVAVIWGLCFVVIQASSPGPAPLLLAGLRAVIGGAVLAGWTVLARRRASARASTPSRLRLSRWRSGLPPVSVLLVLALANAALAFGAMYLAAGRAEAAVASILAGGQPLVLAAAGWVLFGERASVRTIAGLAVAMAGVVVVATTSSGGTSPDGVALSLLAAAAPAVGTVVMRRLGSSIDLVMTTSVQFLLGGLMLLAVSAVVEPLAAVSWSSEAVVGLAILGVLGTGVAYVAWFWLLGWTSLAQLGAALFLIPVVGVVSGILMGDRPALPELLGIAVLLLGIALASVTSRREPPANLLHERVTPRLAEPRS